MGAASLLEKSQNYLTKLCDEIPDRSVASEGNRKATFFFQQMLASFGLETESVDFDDLLNC